MIRRLIVLAIAALAWVLNPVPAAGVIAASPRRPVPTPTTRPTVTRRPDYAAPGATPLQLLGLVARPDVGASADEPQGPRARRVVKSLGVV
jgi:hypothetical protein